MMDKSISNIVFTKNRPLQLEAYLQSLFTHFSPELFQTYILYKVELFEQEYEQLFKKYSNCTVTRENDFHSDLLRVLSQINTEYILFGIDDVVYFDEVDFEVIDQTFKNFSNEIFGFTLRFGQQIINNGKDLVGRTPVAGQVVYSLDWTKGQTPTTRYPFELCATIYRTELIRAIISGASNSNPLIMKLFAPNSALVKTLGKIASRRSLLKKFGYFFNPNTLESWNCRWCQNNAEQLPAFLYFQKLCATAIQVNVVNTSTNTESTADAEYTVEALNEKYRQGYKLDIKAIEQKKPKGTHSEREYFKLTKH